VKGKETGDRRPATGNRQPAMRFGCPWRFGCPLPVACCLLPVACLLLVALAAAGCASAGGTARKSGRVLSLTPAEITRRATPSVVQIRARGRIGSGFVVAADGRIATSLHVVEDADRIVVVLADGRSFTRVLAVAHDEAHDLVVLAIDAEDLPALPLADERVEVGERVVAIGHPQGLENTVSDGLVSAVREQVGGDVLQISAPISPGSSGGPLLNDRGEVVGVTSSTNRLGQNLNFAAPADQLRPLLRVRARRPVSSLPSRFASQLFARCDARELAAIHRGLTHAAQRRGARSVETEVMDLLLELDSCPGVTRVLLFALEQASEAHGGQERADVLAIVLGQLEEALRRMMRVPKSETAGSP
jgi:Trypsin-like peptidase domain